MNPELMTVLNMRQKEMSYQHLTRAATSASSASYFAPTPAYGGAAFGAIAQSPVATSTTFPTPFLGGKAAMSRMCYSPLSVGQMPPTGSNYDQFGFAWHWISDVCAHFALQRQTAHYAVQYAQRILRQRSVTRQDDSFVLRNYEDIYTVQKDLQVLGLACVFIAAKIEEVHPPKAADMAEYISDHGAVTCTADDVTQYEAQYLAELKWSLHPTTVLSWLMFLLSGEASEQPMETMGDFVNPMVTSSIRKEVFEASVNLIDVAFLDYQSLEFLPSVLAGSAILLADPGLDLTYVAQFLQLDPTLLWECKNWLLMATSGLSDLDCNGSRDKDRWAKVPTEEMLFIQTRVPVPSHLAYGLLRVENTTYGYVGEPSNQFDTTMYSGYPGYASSNCISPSSCDTYGCYCSHNDGYHSSSGSTAPNVYHFKYGWQGAEMGYNQPTVQRKLHFS
ncbi:hypothetical protein Poli38472_013560 [Pythium oligandrum]|uniref:Cyclin-like domain-containing protein n=1 Tax=Pythium oligandrum TaxID=41045 RepID=A0A8K1FIT9_PYTOL|nr:hypothetical protein Poli38472_013560 [Pythium oligandrum]|eukprot:TMW61097.1 hypothetical protein Poli38472_013560 [Pythium oligandrum]